MNIVIRATLIFAGMTFGGLVITIFVVTNPSFSFYPLPYSVPKILFYVGSVVSILGLHEVCHCLYCVIKGVRIVGIYGGWKDIGIRVEAPHPLELPLSSLISIPVVVIVSLLLKFPLLVVLFNFGAASVCCAGDVRHFFRDRKHTSKESHSNRLTIFHEQQEKKRRPQQQLAIRISYETQSYLKNEMNRRIGN